MQANVICSYFSVYFLIRRVGSIVRSANGQEKQAFAGDLFESQCNWNGTAFSDQVWLNAVHWKCKLIDATWAKL